MNRDDAAKRMPGENDTDGRVFRKNAPRRRTDPVSQDCGDIYATFDILLREIQQLIDPLHAHDESLQRLLMAIISSRLYSGTRGDAGAIRVLATEIEDLEVVGQGCQNLLLPTELTLEFLVFDDGEPPLEPAGLIKRLRSLLRSEFVFRLRPRKMVRDKLRGLCPRHIKLDQAYFRDAKLNSHLAKVRAAIVEADRALEAHLQRWPEVYRMSATSTHRSGEGSTR